MHSEPDEDEKDERDKGKLMRHSKSPFETKAAKEDVPRFNGRDKQVGWRKKAKNYLHGRCCDINQLVTWA